MATGKISRLPREIREQLNQQLEDGSPGKRLVAWLNELPAVQALLAAEFGGAVINEQNLTNWKQGGYRDWRQEREAKAFTRSFEKQAEVGAALPVVTTEQLATVVAVRYLAVIREWQRSPMSRERRWRQLRVILREVHQLQRAEQQVRRLELERERLEFDRERFEEEKQREERGAMVSILVAAKPWPEVGEAFAGALRLLQARRMADSEGIKVNQGVINKKVLGEDELVGGSCSWASSQPQSACCAGRVGRGATDSTSDGWHNDADLGESKPIKVNQGGINKKVLEEDELVGGACSLVCASKTGRSLPVAVADERVRVRHDGAHGVTRPTYAAVGRNSHPVSVAADGNWAKSKPIKVDQGEIFFRNGRSQARRGICSRHKRRRHPPAPCPSFIRAGPCLSVVEPLSPAISFCSFTFAR